MPELSVKSWLSGDVLTLHDVVSDKYPDGKSYDIAAPCSEDEVLMRYLVQVQEKLSAAIESKDTDAAAKLRVEVSVVIAQLIRDEDGNEIDFDRKMLAGGAYDEMVADGVRPRHLGELSSLVMTNYGTSTHIAQMVLDRAAGEAAARANRASRRAAAKSSPRKQPASKPRAGSKSSRASGASSTRAAQARASTRARKTSGKAGPATKTA